MKTKSSSPWERLDLKEGDEVEIKVPRKCYQQDLWDCEMLGRARRST